MRTTVLLCAMLFSLPLRAGDAPDAAAVRALVAQLGSEDVEARDRACAALVAMGDPVADLIREELKGEIGKDAEVAVRGRECLERIAVDLASKRRWERDPQKDLDEWMATHPCATCGNKAAWRVKPLRHDMVVESLPRVRIYAMYWTCTKHHSIPAVHLAVCRDPDALFEISEVSDLNRLAAYIKPIRSREDFEYVVSSVFGLLSDLTWDGPLGYQPTAIGVKEESGRFVTHEPNSLFYAVWDPEEKKLTIEKRPIR